MSCIGSCCGKAEWAKAYFKCRSIPISQAACEIKLCSACNTQVAAKITIIITILYCFHLTLVGHCVCRLLSSRTSAASSDSSGVT